MSCQWADSSGHPLTVMATHPTLKAHDPLTSLRQWSQKSAAPDQKCAAGRAAAIKVQGSHRRNLTKSAIRCIFPLSTRRVVCSVLQMETAITSAVTRETANAYADFIASLCESPARPALHVLEGGLSDAEEDEEFEPAVQACQVASRGEGAKYDSSLGVVEIAKRIRADIKAAIAAGTIPAIKTSVRISRYSMGRSIDVTVTEAPFAIINPAYTEAVNAGSCVWDLDGIAKYTPEALRVLDVIKDIRDAYNYDRSDAMTDYYDTNFGGGVSYDWRISQ